VDGTVSVPRLLDRATTVALTAGCVRPTVQAATPLLPKEVGTHATPPNWDEAARLILAVLLTLLSVAVTTATSLDVTLSAVAENVAVLDPGATVTFAGT